MEESGESPARDVGILANVRRVEHYFLAGYDHARICAGQLGEEGVVKQLQHLLDDAEETDGRAVEHTELLADPQAREVGSAESPSAA